MLIRVSQKNLAGLATGLQYSRNSAYFSIKVNRNFEGK